jgi:hypothetical protein
MRTRFVIRAPTKAAAKRHRYTGGPNAVRPYFDSCAARRVSASASQPRFNSDSGTLLR